MKQHSVVVTEVVGDGGVLLLVSVDVVKVSLLHLLGVALDGVEEAFLDKITLVELVLVLAVVDSPLVHAVLVSVEGLNLPVFHFAERVGGGVAVEVCVLVDVSVDADRALTGDHANVEVNARGLVPPAHVVAVVPLGDALLLIAKLGPQVPQVLKEGDVPEHDPGSDGQAEEALAVGLAEGGGGGGVPCELGVSFLGP